MVGYCENGRIDAPYIAIPQGLHQQPQGNPVELIWFAPPPSTLELSLDDGRPEKSALAPSFASVT